MSHHFHKYLKNISFGKIFPKLGIFKKYYVINLEGDFVAENRDKLRYYQVALTVRDEKVFEGELRALQKKCVDHYPKTLLTLDMDLETDYDGKKNAT